MIGPTEDLCHVPEYVDGGQQVTAVTGPIVGDFHKILEYFWQPISHQPTLSFGKMFPGLSNREKHDKHDFMDSQSQVNELSEGNAGGRFLTLLVIQSAAQMILTIFASLRACDIFLNGRRAAVKFAVCPQRKSYV